MDTIMLIDRYYRAWTGGDFDAARSCLADDLDFQGSMDTFSDADSFMRALRGFRQMVRSVTLIQSYDDPWGAALLYDCDTATPAGVIRTAKFFKASNELIFSIRLVFDATELRKVMQQGSPPPGT
jgi:SnoaL-like domain